MANATGDCYEANAKHILELTGWGRNDVPNLFLVQGEVSGQGELEGVNFGHCWIEKGNTIIDKSNGRTIEMPKKVYYMLGNIDRNDNLYKYTPKEARKMLFDKKHYGPWELKTSTGL